MFTRSYGDPDKRKEKDSDVTTGYKSDESIWCLFFHRCHLNKSPMFTFESLPPTTKYESCDRVESLQQHRFINICRWHNTHDSSCWSFTRRSILFIDNLPQLSPQTPNMEIMFYELKLNGLNYWNYEERSYTTNIGSLFVWKNDAANTLSRAHVSRIPKQWSWSISNISQIDDSKWATQKSSCQCWLRNWSRV